MEQRTHWVVVHCHHFRLVKKNGNIALNCVMRMVAADRKFQTIGLIQTIYSDSVRIIWCFVFEAIARYLSRSWFPFLNFSLSMLERPSILIDSSRRQSCVYWIEAMLCCSAAFTLHRALSSQAYCLQKNIAVAAGSVRNNAYRHSLSLLQEIGFSLWNYSWIVYARITIVQMFERHSK